MKRVTIDGVKQTKSMLIEKINEKTNSDNPYYFELTYADILAICRQVGISYQI